MARLNISIRDELKAEMDEQDGVNWSAVAASTFERYLLTLKSRKETSTMEQVVERLRASRQANEEQETEEGKEAGRQWAMNGADFDELRRLSKLPDQNYGEPLAEVVGYTIFSFDEEDDHSECAQSIAEFWRDYADTRDPSDAFVGAFWAGALEIWAEVADKL